MTDSDEDWGAVRDLIGRIKVGMLTTLAEDGLRSRPLHTLQLDAEGQLWFFVSASSAKVEEIAHEHGRVAVSYADPAKQDYVSISGSGEIVRNRERMQALWNPWVKVWFPRGVDDPDLALLCVRIEQAEYWNAPGSAVRRLYGLAKARITGDTSAIGEHGRLSAR